MKPLCVHTIQVKCLFSFPLLREGCGMLPLFMQGLLGLNPVLVMGEGQGTPWMSRHSIAGHLMMAVAAPQGATTCTSGAILGFSILLKDTSACSSVPPQGSRGFEPATFHHWATAAPQVKCHCQQHIWSFFLFFIIASKYKRWQVKWPLTS